MSSSEKRCWVEWRKKVTRFVENLTYKLHSLPPPEYAALLKRYTFILNSLASIDMDFNQLDAFLQSQKKKRQVHLYNLSNTVTIFRY